MFALSRSRMQWPQTICRSPSCISTSLAICIFGLHWIQVGGFGHNRAEDEICPCKDPMAPESDTCYQPVCEPGYYRCCATCHMSTCVGHTAMVFSKRGIAECIPCPSGFFCKGCDIFEQCATYSPPTASRDDPPKLSVSKTGSKEALDCVQCSDAEDASLERDRCIEMYLDVCNQKMLKRCYNSCLAADGTKNLTPCEKMKCLMYCAKNWSDDCHGALSRTCRTMTSPPPVRDEDDDLEIDMSMYLIDCDVNCDYACGNSVTAILMVIMLAMLM
eukprot:gnl/MRDRNA2_/MRDRNA2_94300_c0_seq1.p1 gnl/MRDRNA2_/MRDRNA2_94300_c0~~gnl/MRDRNA2_/MRDRNA2_94300_c0_seq1.p1  ORF type:complete len:274 (+),score=32.92 gnl/MRDRNA2_/MRDRNA2_94300_c0_seq1:48-869(+)